MKLFVKTAMYWSELEPSWLHISTHTLIFSLYELWCGESDGQISIYTIKEHTVAGHEILNHYQPVIEKVDVMNMISVGNGVWSYVRPGCIVYQWDSNTKSIVNKLDCSKLVPCSESLKSIAIEEHLSPTNCQVSTLVEIAFLKKNTWLWIFLQSYCYKNPSTMM